MGPRVARRSAADGDAWVRSALGLCSTLEGVRRTGLALVEGGGRGLRFCASDRDNAITVDWCEIDAYEHVPLNDAVRTGRPVVGSLPELAHLYPVFVERQSPEVGALAALPIVAGGHPQGGLVVFYDAPQRFDGPQLSALELLAGRLGTDLRRAQRVAAPVTRSLADEPVKTGVLAHTCVFASDLTAVARARGVVRDTLVAWGVDEETVETAILCVSELVTNAMIHSDGGCELTVALDRGILTALVRDRGLGLVVDLSMLTVEPLAVHGRGLRLVDALSARWGSELDSVGMTVWFVIELAEDLVVH